jgi:hypothetical protein
VWPISPAPNLAVEDLALDHDPGSDAPGPTFTASRLGARRRPFEQVFGERGGSASRWRRSPAGRSGAVRIAASGRSRQSRLTAQRIVPVAASTRPGVPTADAEDRALGRGERDELVDQAGEAASARRRRGLGGHLAPSRTSPRRLTSAPDERAARRVDGDDEAGVVDDLEEDRGLAAARRAEPDLATRPSAIASPTSSLTVVRVSPSGARPPARLTGP